MESSTESGTLQVCAEEFLRSLLQGCSREDVPRRIIALAIQTEDNAVKRLFRANDNQQALNQTISNDSKPPETKPHKAKLSLRFGRSKEKAKAGPSTLSNDKSSHHDYQNVFQADVKPSNHELERRGQQRPGLLSGVTGGSSRCKAPSGGSALNTYNCVFCHTDYTTKGTCKRHIEEIHISKRYFRCVMCSRHFGTAPEVRKHTARCGLGVLGWVLETPPVHKMYSSEFVAHQIFATQQLYISHLLELSHEPAAGRPVRSWHLKLRNLLELRELESALRNISIREFNDPEGWRSTRWEHERVKKAVNELELGELDRELGPHDMLRLHKIRQFLEDLFADRATSTAVSTTPSYEVEAQAENAQTETQIEVQSEVLTELDDEKGAIKVEAIEEEEEEEELESSPTPPRQVEPTPKRPLSFESSVAAPTRHPPGPPTPGPNIQTHHSVGHQPPNSRMDSMPQVQSYGYVVTPMPQTPTLETEQMNGPMMFWAAPDQQPPPYEGGFSQPAMTQSMQSLMPEQTYTNGDDHMGYHNGFLPLVDMPLTSAMTSPAGYMASSTDNMSFYSQSPHHFAQMTQGQDHSLPMVTTTSYSPMNFSPAAPTYSQQQSAPELDPQQQQHHHHRQEHTMSHQQQQQFAQHYQQHHDYQSM
jgi:hypothetical protein